MLRTLWRFVHRGSDVSVLPSSLGTTLPKPAIFYMLWPMGKHSGLALLVKGVTRGQILVEPCSFYSTPKKNVGLCLFDAGTQASV